MPEQITISGCKVGRGEQRDIDIDIARLPTRTNIDLPVHISRARQEGPVLLLTGGLHGDELNGIEIIRRMIVNDMLEPQKGTVIAIPLVNIYGFIQSSRGMPDGKDINRSFPGIKGGSLARLLAYTLMHEIIPHVDVGIDFHTGGAARANYPQIRCVLGDEKNEALARAFEAPITVNSSHINKSFRKAANKEGKTILVYESGESIRYSEHGIQCGMDGTLRLMEYLGMKEGAPSTAYEMEVFQKTTWVRAKYAGLFKARIKLGDTIKKKELLGHITDPFGQDVFKCVSPRKGRVIGLNYAPTVHKGDALLHIAYNNALCD